MTDSKQDIAIKIAIAKRKKEHNENMEVLQGNSGHLPLHERDLHLGTTPEIHVNRSTIRDSDSGLNMGLMNKNIIKRLEYEKKVDQMAKDSAISVHKMTDPEAKEMARKHLQDLRDENEKRHNFDFFNRRKDIERDVKELPIVNPTLRNKIAMQHTEQTMVNDSLRRDIINLHTNKQGRVSFNDQLTGKNVSVDPRNVEIVRGDDNRSIFLRTRVLPIMDPKKPWQIKASKREDDGLGYSTHNIYRKLQTKSPEGINLLDHHKAVIQHFEPSNSLSNIDKNPNISQEFKDKNFFKPHPPASRLMRNRKILEK